MSISNASITPKFAFIVTSPSAMGQDHNHSHPTDDNAKDV